MKYTPSETRSLLSHSAPSNLEEKPKKAPSIKSKIAKTLKKAGKAWYNEMDSSADAGGKVGEAIAKKLTRTKNTPDSQISPTSKKIIKTGKAIGEFTAAFKEVYPAVAKIPVNLLKDKDAQIENSVSEKPAKREGFFKATGRFLIENTAQGLDLGEELGRRATGIKSGSIRKASFGKELTVRAFQAAGFVAGYSLAISTALIGIPQRMLVPQNKTSNDYINAPDSEYKYTGLARRGKTAPLPPSYDSHEFTHYLPAYPKSSEFADYKAGYKDEKGLLPSDSASIPGDKSYMDSQLPLLKFDDRETAEQRRRSESQWDAEVASNSPYSTPAQSVVSFAPPIQTIPPVPSLIFSDGQSSVQTSSSFQPSHFSPLRPLGSFPPRFVPDDQTTALSAAYSDPFTDKHTPSYEPSALSIQTTSKAKDDDSYSDISGLSSYIPLIPTKP